MAKRLTQILNDDGRIDDHLKLQTGEGENISGVIASIVSAAEKIPALVIFSSITGIVHVRTVVNKWKFSDSMMGEQFITFTVTSEKPIDWAVGDFCVFRGETFALNYVPSVTQKSRTRERPDAYTYENVKFESYHEELTRILMLDITPTTGEYVPALGTNYTGSSRFQLFCGETSVIVSGERLTYTPVCALAAKIQANLDRAYPDSWHIYVDTTSTYVNPSGKTILVTHTEDKVLSFDNTTVAKALEEVHSTFDLDYCIRGRNIYIGYNLKNLTSDNDNETFAFGYGKGYPTRDNSGTALFQIKRIANSQQKIVTRLRALGSTKNIPYRYYNKKYNLSQSLFPTNLQLPDTFATPAVKNANNSERDSIYGVNQLSELPYLRHVKGETNDAYIDKNDDADLCAEGVREDSARWDGSNGDLPEIYPTIEEATYGELRGAMVEDQDGNTGNNSFPGYLNDERIDELLAVGYESDGVQVDDANQGSGILPDSGTTDVGISRSAVIGLTSLYYNNSNYGDFSYRNGSYWGIERTLFVIQDVYSGRYAMVPTGPNYASVKYNFGISCYIDGVSADIGFQIAIQQKSKETGEVTTIATYLSDFIHISRGATKEVSLPEIPDVKEGSNAKVQEIVVTELSDITVKFTPVMRNVSVPSGFTDIFTLVYQVGASRIDTTNPYEPEYTWKSLDDGVSQDDTFHVFIKDMGFDITACWTNDTPVVAMKSGRCVGREFEIGENVQKVTYNGRKGYMLTLHRAKDSSLNTYYPSATDPIAAGDNYVLLNISMPEVYVKMAEVRLLMAATDYLADNCETQFTYQPYIDDIYLQRNYENMVDAGTPERSIFWRLYAGLRFTFRGIPSNEDDPLPLADLTIEKLTISMGEGLTPKVEMTLNNDVQQTTLQKLTTTVDRIYNGSLFGGGGGLGSSSAALLSLLQTEGGKMFLSKKNKDTARGIITFLQGLNVGNGVYGLDGNGAANLERILLKTLQGESYTGEDIVGDKGFRLWQDADGLGNLIVDNLTVRLKAYFAELEIRKVSFTGGDLFFSSAGSKIVMVKPVDAFGNVLTPTYEVLRLLTADGKFLSANGTFYAVKTTEEYTDEELAALTHAWRCYEMSDDGTTQTKNYWQPGDMARCQTFNIEEDGKYEGAKNRYYGRLAIRTGREELEDGLTYNYVDLSTDAIVDIDGTTCSGYDNRQSIVNDIPAVGDHIAQVGSQTDTDRQSLIELCLSDGGSINLYSGVDDWNLASHRIISEGANGFVVNSQWFKIQTAGGVEQTIDEYKQGAEIVTDSASIVVNASNDGTIDSVARCAGLPVVLSIRDGGQLVPVTDWYIICVNDVYLLNRSGQPMPSAAAVLRPAKSSETATTYNLTWSYHPISFGGQMVPMASGKMKLSAQYYIGTELRRVSLELPLIVSREGQSGQGVPVTITLSPSTIIVEERLEEDEQTGDYVKVIDYTSAYADVWITDGTTTTTPSHLSVITSGTGITAEVTANRIAVTAVADGVRQAVLGVSATYNGASYDLQLAVYVNRMGTWEMQAIGDIMTSISTREITIYDELGQPVTTTSISKFYQDSTRISVGADTIEFKSGDGTVTYMKMNIVRNSQQQITGYKVHADNMNIDNLTAENLHITGNSTFEGQLNGATGSFSGQVTATSGSIGGFQIAEGRIGAATDIDNPGDTNGLSLFDDFIVFNERDRQAILGTWQNYGADILARLTDIATDTGKNYALLPKYGIVFDIRNSINGNFAFKGNGAGVLNGMIDGYKLREITLAQPSTMTHIGLLDDSNRILIKSTANNNSIVLPSVTSVRNALGIGSSTTFAFRLIIIADYGTQDFKVYGRNTVSQDFLSENYPLFTDHNGNITNITMVTGDTLEVMLIYEPSSSVTIDGETTYYTARLINRED